jgi:hypothetical protein
VFLQEKTFFIDRQLKIYKSLPDIMKKRYGKKEPKHKQQEVTQKLDEEHIRLKLQKELTLEDAKRLTEEDYIQYAQHHPQDTAGVLRRFLDGLYNTCRLTH